MLNKKMLLSVLIVGVVASVAGAGTWAYLDDTESSTGNTLTAGTMDLTLDGTDGIVGQEIGGADVAPGVTDQPLDTITVANDGSVSGNLVVSVANIVNNGNGIENDAEDEDDNDEDGVDEGELASELTVTISDGTTAYSGLLSELTNKGFGALDGTASKDITVTYSVDGDADNSIQGDSLAFDIVFTLTQPTV